MIDCPSCGEDEELRGVALGDGRRQITCESCGHSWTRGTATRVVASPASSRNITPATSASCGPRWDDEPVVATLNREAPNREHPALTVSPCCSSRGRSRRGTLAIQSRIPEARWRRR